LADSAPDRTAIHTSDVADSAAMQAVAADWMARHGAPDLVIANAGVVGGFDTAVATDLAVPRRMLEINLPGAATTFQPFLAAAGVHPAQPLALVGEASIASWPGMATAVGRFEF
jgi:NAD(P)-dependent dehydrogenase (short-subunit alcohol dehydrogenase family)